MQMTVVCFQLNEKRKSKNHPGTGDLQKPAIAKSNQTEVRSNLAQRRKHLGAQRKMPLSLGLKAKLMTEK